LSKRSLYFSLSVKSCLSCCSISFLCLAFTAIILRAYISTSLGPVSGVLERLDLDRLRDLDRLVDLDFCAGLEQPIPRPLLLDFPK